MERYWVRNEEMCPECGHLLPTRTWSCQFCGWAVEREQPQKSWIDPWHDLSEINQPSRIDMDVDRLIAPA